MNFCPTCGFKLDGCTNFCPSCGRSLNTVNQGTAANTSQASSSTQTSGINLKELGDELSKTATEASNKIVTAAKAFTKKAGVEEEAAKLKKSFKTFMGKIGI